MRAHLFSAKVRPAEVVFALWGNGYCINPRSGHWREMIAEKASDTIIADAREIDTEMSYNAMCWIRYVILMFGLLVCRSVSHAEMLSCDQQTRPGVNCLCDLRSLRPLQGAVGMGEVLEKRAKIEKKTEKAKRHLAADPIKVVRGPGGRLFVTDHHHDALAWLMAGISSGVCSIEADASSTDSKEFWVQLQERHKVRLADKNGAAITPDSLPKALTQLPDDPYRTLAWMIRKSGGFCRQLLDHKEFAEFVWADWLRERTELPPEQIMSSPAKMLPAALKLAKSSAAAGLPGYVGDNKRCEDEE